MTKRIATVLYAYSFLDELVLIYPVYTLLFTDTGLSVGQISSLFVIWSTASLVLEVPSGAWADAVSRRFLLVLGPLLTAVAYALWVAAPSYWIFALGFALWGLKSALQSGALEALVYEELDRLGDADRYATVMGRAESVGTLGVVVAMAGAAPVLALGGYPAVGAASAIACTLAAAVATAFPEHRTPRPNAGAASGRSGAEPAVKQARLEAGPAASTAEDVSWTATLRAGLAEARHSHPVRSAVVLVALVWAVWGALDEYTPLLISGTGVSDSKVPLFLLLIWAGVAVGGLFAGRGARLSTRRYAVLLVAAALALALGALTGHPVGIVAVAVAFGAFQLASVVADARLQNSITGPARATVTSLAGMSADVATIGVYASYGALATAAGHGGAFALLSSAYPLVARWLVRGSYSYSATRPGDLGRLLLPRRQ
jgi:MFS family permease